MESANSFFSLVFSSSSDFSRFASETVSPPYLMGWSAPFSQGWSQLPRKEKVVMEIKTIGIDVGKIWFHAVCFDKAGAVVVRSASIERNS